MTIRLLLVDDQRLVRAGLRALCASADDIEVVGEAADGLEAVRLADRLAPHVVLMDLRMPRMDGTEATAAILARRPQTRITVLTTFDDDDHLYPALAAGACGFLVKDATPTELLDGIRRAFRDENPFSPAVLRSVGQPGHAGPRRPAGGPGGRAGRVHHAGNVRYLSCSVPDCPMPTSRSVCILASRPSKPTSRT